MTTSSPTRDQPLTSRRVVLAGLLGGIGAWAASAAGRATPVHAEGEPMTVGGDYLTATTPTSLTNQTNAQAVLQGTSTSSGIGVQGTSFSGSGVYGSSSTSIGVFGASNSQWGVFGTGPTGVYGTGAVGVYGGAVNYGVSGYSEGGNGVRGTSDENDGVVGSSGSAAHSGVWGNHTSGGYGVAGSSNGAAPKAGVWGSNSGTGFGVLASSTSGHALHASATSGIAGFFEGRVFTTKFYEMTEVSTPAAPGSNKARLFVKDNGSGKTQLCVRFHSGAVRILATQG